MVALPDADEATVKLWDGKLPANTTVTWADANQVKQDAQTAGDYTENALVTFPDGSTTTVATKLHVLAVKDNNEPTTPDNPAKPDNPSTPDNPTTPTTPTDDNQKKPSTDNSQNGGKTTPSNDEQKPSNNDDQGDTTQPTAPVAGNPQKGVDNGMVVNNTKTTATTKLQTVASNKGEANKLPQTGNETNALGVLGLAMLGLTGLLGLTGINRKAKRN